MASRCDVAANCDRRVVRERQGVGRADNAHNAVRADDNVVRLSASGQTGSNINGIAGNTVAAIEKQFGEGSIMPLGADHVQRQEHQHAEHQE